MPWITEAHYTIEHSCEFPTDLVPQDLGRVWLCIDCYTQLKLTRVSSTIGNEWTRVEGVQYPIPAEIDIREPEEV